MPKVWCKYKYIFVNFSSSFMFVLVFISLSVFAPCFSLFSQSHYLSHWQQLEHFRGLNIFTNCPFSVFRELRFWSASHEFNIFFGRYTTRQWIVYIHTNEIFKYVFASPFLKGGQHAQEGKRECELAPWLHPGVSSMLTAVVVFAALWMESVQPACC